MDFLRQSQLPNKPRPPQGAQSSMGNFPTLQAYQQQQDAFVQQHLRNQAQYNQGLQSGQSPQRVPVMEAWKQAGENIQSGQYQGNPFQTGNVDAIMGMFGQYGIQAPQGFRDQLLQNLGQQSAPPMYQPQPGMGYPGGPMQPPAAAPGYPKFTNPATGLPYGQPVTDGPIGPNGEYWPGFRSPPAMPYPGGPMQPQPAMGSPELTPRMQVPDSWVLRMPQSTRPNVPSGWSVRDLGRGFYSIEAPGQSQADVAAWASQAGASDLSPNRFYDHIGLPPNPPQPPTSRPPVAPPPMTYPGGPMKPPAPAPQPWQMGQQPQMTYPGDLGAIPGFGPATGLPYGQPVTDGPLGPSGEYWPAFRSPPPMPYPGGPMPPMAPGYGGRIGLPPGSPVTMDFRDRDGDMTDDRNQLGPGQSPPASYSQPPQAPAAPKPSDQWSYPLLPGHTRGPSGEQIMSSDARQAEIRRREQESGLTYVTRQDGKGGSWVRATKPNPKASISLNPEQAAGMKQYMESRQASRAQPTPPRTQGTPYRGRRR